MAGAGAATEAAATGAGAGAATGAGASDFLLTFLEAEDETGTEEVFEVFLLIVLVPVEVFDIIKRAIPFFWTFSESNFIIKSIFFQSFIFF